MWKPRDMFDLWPTCTRPLSSAVPPATILATSTYGLMLLCFTKKPRPVFLCFTSFTLIVLGEMFSPGGAVLGMMRGRERGRREIGRGGSKWCFSRVPCLSGRWVVFTVSCDISRNRVAVYFLSSHRVTSHITWWEIRVSRGHVVGSRDDDVTWFGVQSLSYRVGLAWSRLLTGSQQLLTGSEHMSEVVLWRHRVEVSLGELRRKRKQTVICQVLKCFHQVGLSKSDILSFSCHIS